MRRKHLLLMALCTVAILLAFAFVVQSLIPPALSPLETRLVGAWSDTSDAEASEVPSRNFRPDGTFSTPDDDFEGRWFIHDNKLTIEYWQPFRIREVYSVKDFFIRLRISRKTHTHTWEIEFSDDDQTHTLIFPEDHPRNPGDKWIFMRRSGK